jgi:hypothetical protein
MPMAEVPRPQDIEILPLGLKGLLTVPDGASGIEEPGTLDRVVSLATAWFVEYLDKRAWS